MNKAAYAVAFVCGAVVGAAAWSVYKEKKAKSLEERQEVVDDFEDVQEPEDDEAEEVTILSDKDKAAVTQVVDDIIAKSGYSVGDHTNDGDDDDGPYVIAPDEFGDFEDYDAISMTLTSDGVLVDTDGTRVEDPENSVGTNYMKYFGVYPDDPDSVYIRNDDLCCDFEIVKDLRTFEEIDADIPHMKWRDNE